MKNFWNIRVVDTSETSRFAAAEFLRIMRIMDLNAVVSLDTDIGGVEEGTTESAESLAVFPEGNNEKEKRFLYIGYLSKRAAMLPISDPARDDAIEIKVKNCRGYITGTNARSVLIGVYRFFTEAGCLFIRPGTDGEYIPRINSSGIKISLSEAAAYRHRGICIEGAVSYENVAEMIDWAPKAGFNAYFTQFFTPLTFFDRWYRHQNNPYLLPTPISGKTAEGFMADIKCEMAKRGMMHHAVGHGWTAKALGLPAQGWYKYSNDEVAPERRGLIASVGGRRELWKGVAINTNLCYSNPEARSMMADEIVKYARENRATDYIHVWLADAANNHCECPDCVGTMPADLYIKMLNEADTKLAAENLATRLVFLLYIELLWPPLKERFNNPDRFTLMFAPISRSYTEAMYKEAAGSMMPYVRNNIPRPKAVGDTLAYLRAWQEIFQGDSFVFDYHYMWDHFKDPGYYSMAKVLHDDIENLKDIGLNGYISCQNQRVFMPNGLGMHMMGSVLWSGVNDFNNESEKYFKAAYGKDWRQCRNFLRKMSEKFDPPALRKEKPSIGKKAMVRYAGISGYIEAFMPVIRRNLEGWQVTEVKDCAGSDSSRPLAGNDSQALDICRRMSWEYMEFYAGVLRKLSTLLVLRSSGDMTAMNNKWSEIKEYVCLNEYKYQRVFDVSLFIGTWTRIIK